jgi:hypothetical protein
MIAGLPQYIPIAVTLICSYFLALWLLTSHSSLHQLHRQDATRVTLTLGGVLVLWLAFQGLLAWQGFYSDAPNPYPRLFLAIGPPLTSIPILLILPSVNAVLNVVSLSLLTKMHLIRIPVELVLWSLFRSEKIPKLMTFAGANPDILVGLSAPVVGYLCFTKRVVPLKFALVWHLIGLACLSNVSLLFLLSVPSPYQLLHGDHPNRALLYFPFIWVLSFGVPTTFLAHLIAIKRLWRTPHTGA